MLINLSDVLSDQHKTVEETVPLTMGEIRMKFGKYPIVESEPVHVRVEHVRGKEMLIYADTRLVTVIPCDRCLEDVRYEFALDFAKHVDIGLSDAELTEELDESNFIDGYHLDVDKLLRNEIVLTNYGAPKEYYDGRAVLVDPMNIDEIGEAIMTAMDKDYAQPELMCYMNENYSEEACCKLLDKYIQEAISQE